MNWLITQAVYNKERTPHHTTRHHGTTFSSFSFSSLTEGVQAHVDDDGEADERGGGQEHLHAVAGDTLQLLAGLAKGRAVDCA